MFYVMSQDGKLLRPIDSAVDYEENPVGECVIYCGHNFMGKYDTLEDCKTVMGQLKNAIANGKHIFQFPKGVFR